MALQVVHADQVGAGRQGNGFRRRHAHQERPDQTRTDRDGHPVDLAEPREAGGLQRLCHERVQRLDVRTRCHLRHHASEPFVQVDLGGDQVGANGEPILHHRDGGLVARGLDAKGYHAGRTPSGNVAAISESRRVKALDLTSSVHMISASSFISW